MPGDQNIKPSLVRLDFQTAGAYLPGQNPDKPKSHFFRSLFSSIIAPVGGVAAALCLGPAGLPAAALMFGLGKTASDSVVKSQMKEQALAQQSQQSRGSQQIQLPGLFETTPMSAGAAATDFIAPKSMESDISQVVVNREMAINNETHGFQY